MFYAGVLFSALNSPGKEQTVKAQRGAHTVRIRRVRRIKPCFEETRSSLAVTAGEIKLKKEKTLRYPALNEMKK